MIGVGKRQPLRRMRTCLSREGGLETDITENGEMVMQGKLDEKNERLGDACSSDVFSVIGRLFTLRLSFLFLTLRFPYV